MYRNHRGKMLQFLGLGVGRGKTEPVSLLCHRFFTQPWTSPTHTHREVGITLGNEEKFPLLRKRREKCSSQAVSSCAVVSVRERLECLKSLQLVGERRWELLLPISGHRSSVFSCCFLRQGVKQRNK